MARTGEALIDTSIVYGAMRFYHGVHDDPSLPRRGTSRKEEDHLLFLELLHHIMLYDRLVLESSNSETDLWLSKELSDFIQTINGYLQGGSSLIEAIQIGRNALRGSIIGVQRSLCKLISAKLSEGATDLDTIKTVKVSSLYISGQHHDYNDLLSECDAFALPHEVIPFALLVWRGLLYAAIASRWSRSENKRVAYVAAPGRMVALRVILNAADFAKFESPRNALRELSAILPNLSPDGYEFSDLSSLPDFSGLSSLPILETSSLSNQLAGLSPDSALREVCRLRGSSSIRNMRADWMDVLFEGASMCGIGGTHIQIVRDSTIHGDLIQEQQYIRAMPVK